MPGASATTTSYCRAASDCGLWISVTDVSTVGCSGSGRRREEDLRGPVFRHLGHESPALPCGQPTFVRSREFAGATDDRLSFPCTFLRASVLGLTINSAALGTVLRFDLPDRPRG